MVTWQEFLRRVGTWQRVVHSIDIIAMADRLQAWVLPTLQILHTPCVVKSASIYAFVQNISAMPIYADACDYLCVITSMACIW